MELKERIGLKLQKNRLLSELTTIGIGGPAKWAVEVKTVDDLREVLAYCNEESLPYFVLGKGSNCVFDDQGLDALLILNRIDFVEEIEPGLFRAGAGHSFSRLGGSTARHNWSGLEFASGIPASVGGAVFMNAGANGHETCETLVSVEFIESDGALRTYLRDELQFSYRHSPFQEMKGVITAATFRLTPSQEAREKQLKIINYRTATQPYGEKSAGCIFRNPANNHAGALIDQAGLKGTTVGDAAVSGLHANFLINLGSAQAKDLKELMKKVQEQVKNQTGIQLEPEVRFIPYRIVND
jgi:UDP-N-acetylmuramate dehydrogenase